jgi:hypothetical protein
MAWLKTRQLEVFKFKKGAGMRATDYLFAYCDAIQSVDISSLVNVISTGSMFCGTPSLVLPKDLSPLINTTKANSMFEDVIADTIDLQYFSNVVFANSMFRNSAIRTIDLSPLSKVMECYNMLDNCASLQSVTGNHFAEQHAGFDMIFNECTELVSIDLPDTKFTSFYIQPWYNYHYKLNHLVFSPESPFNSGNIPVISLKNCSFSGAGLDAVFELLPVLVDKIIDISLNPGVFDCHPEIARAKGWTVEGIPIRPEINWFAYTNQYPGVGNAIYFETNEQMNQPGAQVTTAFTATVDGVPVGLSNLHDDASIPSGPGLRWILKMDTLQVFTGLEVVLFNYLGSEWLSLNGAPIASFADSQAVWD